jgi:pyridoxamine 5'-phosphate oxidase
MALSTVDASGRPCSRNVLLRGLDEAGDLQFFTNRLSRKGRDLAGNPNVCLLFSWLGIHRQVRIQGTAAPVDDVASDEYFDGRPRASRIGAWASEQSTVLADRSVLEERVAASTARFGDGPVPRPPHWGGYAVTPVEFEFWQGRPSRLHDRLRYRPRGDGGWVVERLSP